MKTESQNFFVALQKQPAARASRIASILCMVCLLLCGSQDAFAQPDTDGPTGGTFTLDKTLCLPSDTITASFSGWVDPSGPLRYMVVFYDIPINSPGTASSIAFSPGTEGAYMVAGYVYDDFGNWTQVGALVTVDGTPPVITTVSDFNAVATSQEGAWVS